jgi:hypothetical protein
MAENGGTTTQSGIHYQNSIAALYLGRLLDSRQRIASDRVIEVRVEAPEHVDDVIVYHADGSRSFIQAKEAISSASDVWTKLWSDFARQAHECKDAQYKLILAVGTLSAEIGALREICDRAKGKRNSDEWMDSLSATLKTTAQKIVTTLAENTVDAAFQLTKHVEVWIWPLDVINRDMAPLWIPSSSVDENTLFKLLLGSVGGQARVRGVFNAIDLLNKLWVENRISIHDSEAWGTDAYLRAIKTEMGVLTVPGTNLRGPIQDLFLWLPLRDKANNSAHSDFEEEDPRWRWGASEAHFDLRDFPQGSTARAVIDAGAGFGKTTMLHAIAHRLSSGVYMPAVIPLDALASSNLSVLGYLNDKINSDYSVSIDWERLCESGRAAILLDGLDELSATDRTNVLTSINRFAARFHQTSFLLTVRDSTALTVPLGVPVLTLARLDDDAIKKFADSYAKHGGNLSYDALFKHLQRHPDLAHLLRIPLFLALVLATAKPDEDLPKSRSELLENYLGILFSPERHKSTATPLEILSDIREASELLAWRGLENDGIGLSEVAAKRLLKAQGLSHQPDTYVERMLRIGVLRRTSARLRFAYPIVQEYLAACWMVANAPNEVGPRFANVYQRPWAQALQFALEMHPDADSIISNQLAARDDAFFTSLRLIARCIVNGANVSAPLRTSIGERLAKAWPSESFSIKMSIGYLISDGFFDPLPLLAIEHISNWALYCGGAEVIVKKASPELTCLILKKRLSRDLTNMYFLHEWQSAVDDIADTALDLYLARVRNSSTTKEELAVLSSLICEISPSRLSPGRWQQVTADTTLPTIIRLSGYKLGPKPLDSTAWEIISDVFALSEADERLSNFRVHTLFWHMKDAEEKFSLLINSPACSEKRVRHLLEGLMNSDISIDSRLKLLRGATRNPGLSEERRFLILLCMASWKDRDAERETIPMLSTQSAKNVTSWLYRANLFSDQTIQEAAIQIANRAYTSEEMISFITSADFGLSYKMDYRSFDGAAANEPHIHPARMMMLNTLAACIREDDNSVAALRVRTRFGEKSAGDKLLTWLQSFIAGVQGTMQYKDDSIVHSVLHDLANGISIPPDLLFQILDKSVSNAGSVAVALIPQKGNESSISQLVIRFNSRPAADFVRESIFSGLETLSGRYGLRIVREDSTLSIER